MKISSPAIKLLDPHTINQIAAGEVIERPASVVKELLENSFDAGATRIKIELEDAGRTLIRITDNGCGMSQVDAEASLLRHATSKIKTAEDLFRIDSLGFRGEALPSIASVSRFKIASTTEDGIRTVIQLDGGDRAPVRYDQGPAGTEISVEDLFFNTPARLKFLKRDQTELGQIIEFVGKYAISFPSVSIKLTHHTTTILETPGDGDVLNALAAVWGREVVAALAEISHIREGMRVRGFISAPHFTRATRSQQWIFVNGRPIRNRALYSAIDTAYRSITPEKRYPVALILIDIEPSRVDMNVSPTKSEVRFTHEGQVFDTVRTAIKDALLENGMVPSMEDIARVRETQANYQSAVPGLANPMPNFNSWTSYSPPGSFENSYQLQRPVEGGFDSAIVPNEPSLIPKEDNIDQSFSQPLLSATDRFLDGLKIHGQTQDQFFILAENRDGVMIIDQHVAHERILFEYLCRTRGQVPIETQPLLTPVTLEFDKRTIQSIEPHLGELLSAGYLVDIFGATSLIVRSVPVIIRQQDPITALKEIVEDLVEGSGGGGLSARENVWVMCACKMSIKAGERLSMPEMEKLLFDLATTENPYLCPHGRPITIMLSRNELLRKFKR